MAYDLVVVGGGAAGFFCAIQCAERNPKLKIVIVEKSKELLSKVRISGGGRCNVTHACFDPAEMVTKYPRGNKELLGPFHRFLCGDMMGWLSDHGVETKIEDDGRVFPASNSSTTIINCFIDLCQKYNIEISTSCGLEYIKSISGSWQIQTSTEVFNSKNLLIASGSSPATWKMIRKLGHQIIQPVPSLFTFNIKNPLIQELAGISMPNANVTIPELKLEDSGPLLITHWGLSGPAILKLSAWAARELSELKYQFSIEVNWVGMDYATVLEEIQSLKQTHGKKGLLSHQMYQIPKRLWHKMIYAAKLDRTNFASANSQQMEALATLMSRYPMEVKGKSTFKDEFVTCGGIDTKEINFKSMESKLFPNLFFAGEVINIDAITGGFNFQAAWTTAYIAAESIV